MSKLLTLSQFSTSMNSFADKCDARFLQISNAGSLATKDKVALADFDTDATAKITALNTLIGSDTSKSARTIANEELAAQLIPASAQEALDTLQEIAAWIQSHPAEASAINAKLTLGTYEDETTHEQVQYATVKAYVEAYVADQIGDAELNGSSSIDITNGVVSAIVNAANGLSIDANNGISLAAAVASSSGVGGSNGAMTATQAEKLAGLENTTSGNGVTVTNHSAAINIDSSNARGLSVSSNGLAMALATPDTYTEGTKTADGTAGALSPADKYKLDSLVEATDLEVASVIAAIWAS